MLLETGVDALSFGGTKQGMLCGEAVVFLKPGLGADFPYWQKHSMQLASKMRFISAQFEGLLENDLWIENGRQANAMAQRLLEAVRAPAEPGGHPSRPGQRGLRPHPCPTWWNPCSERPSSGPGTSARAWCAGCAPSIPSPRTSTGS